MLKILKNKQISENINKISNYFRKNARGIEKCRTFAPAELNEGSPLKMI